MSEIWAIAVGAVSPLGCGREAYALEQPGQAARTAIGRDDMLAQAGLARPNLARAPADLGVAALGDDRASNLLLAAFEQLCAQLDGRRAGWRQQRLGVCVGSSSGGMLSAEELFSARAEDQVVSPSLARRATYFAPLDFALQRCALAPTKRSQILAACASSTIALGLAARWLQRDACDLVLAGGYDAVSLFVAAGFEAIRATTPSSPQPFRQGRAGMALGEGAALVALVRPSDGLEPLFRIAGFGASSDAVHITAPDREGAGLIRAGRAALEEAGCSGKRVDLVSAHATATPYNDAAEAKAIHALCGRPTPVVHPFKAQIGHTLGAAGVLEALAAVDGLRRGIAPPSWGDAPLDPDAEVTLLERAESRPLRTALKLSAAFGGVSAALLLTTEQRTAALRPLRPVHVVAHASVNAIDKAWLAEASGIARDRLARIDPLGQLALSAVAKLAQKEGRAALDGAGVVAGHSLATLDTNERFNERLLKKGPRLVDPRLFPATSPNACAGHCAIAFGLHGPNFAVGAGLCGSLEALLAAAELVAAGDVERMVVVAADDAGAAARHWADLLCPDRPQEHGAVALLLEPGQGSQQVDLDMSFSHDSGPIGQLALRAWLADGASD